MQGINKIIPIEEKASLCWTQAFEKCKPIYRDFNDQVLHVVDRECDIYELLQFAFNEKAPFVMRSSANRRADVGRVRDSSAIYEKLAASTNLAVVVIKKDSKGRTC